MPIKHAAASSNLQGLTRATSLAAAKARRPLTQANAGPMRARQQQPVLDGRSTATPTWVDSLCRAVSAL